MKNYFSNHYSQMQGIDSNSEQSIRDWYNSVIPAYEAELKPYLSLMKDKSVLEIGCGIGGLLNYLIKIGHKSYFGIDQSSEQINICRKYVTDKVVEKEASEFLNENKIKYDFIIMFDLIEHIQKDKIIPLLKLLINSLNKNGKILIRTPNMGSLLAAYSRYIDFTHELGFTEESLIQILNEAGIYDIEIKNSNTSKKRIFILILLNRLFKKLYYMKENKIVTVNIVALANVGGKSNFHSP